MNVTILPNGDLKLTASNSVRAYIADEMRRGRRGNVLYDLLEFEICNGSFTPFDADDGNPFVGLTSAPCIAEAMTTEDDGTNVIIGRLWWFPDYMIRDELGELRDRGRVVYTLADTEGEG
jgi:hypothetical protein